MSYRREREEFIARMSREGLPMAVTRLLLREATGLNRRAELACSSEAADRDRVPCPRSIAERRYATAKLASATKAFAQYPCLCDFDHAGAGHTRITRITLQDWQSEQRLTRALATVNVSQGHYTGNETQRGLWSFTTEGDPRGYVLRVIPPSYAERNAGCDRHNLSTIGVPSGPSGLRW